MTISPPLYWLKQLRDKQKELQEIPLWGAIPLFPWQEFSEKMATLLEIPDFRVYAVGQDFQMDESNLLGIDFKPLSFQLSPLPGMLSWLFPQKSLEALTTLLCSGPQSRGIFDPQFQEGFYQFLVLQTSKQIADMQIYKNLHIQWGDKNQTPPLPYFFLEIGLHVHEQTFFGKLVISTDFQKAFRSHFIQSSFTPLNFPLAKEFSVQVHLRIGRVLLSLVDWEQMRPGDFLVLDQCTYDPEMIKGNLDLFWEETPIFSAKIKKNTLKILDYAVYEGDLNPMDTEFSDHFSAENDEFSFSEMDDDLPEDLQERQPTPPPEEPQEEVHEEAAKENPIPVPPAEDLANEPIASIKDTTLPIVIELDRIKMSLEKLLQLQPGNVLELAVHPEQGVYLTVHGKKIARGELLKIGEVLGVKILEMGHPNQP